MKKILFKIIMIGCINIYSQTLVSKDSIINCDKIKDGLIDRKITDYVNGKYIVKINLNKEEVYLIRNSDNKKFYYVSRELMDKIKKCKCKGIKIEKLKKRNDKNSPKIVRD